MVEYQTNQKTDLDLKNKSSYPSGKASTESNRLLISNMEGMDGAYGSGPLQRRVTDGRTPVFSFEDVKEHYCSGKRDGRRGGYGGDGPEGKEAGGELEIPERAPEAGMKKTPVVQRVAGAAVAAGAFGLLAVGYLRRWWQRRRDNRQREENAQGFQEEAETAPTDSESLEAPVETLVEEPVEAPVEAPVEESVEEGAAEPQPIETEEQRAINARFLEAKHRFTELQTELYNCLPFVHELSIFNELIINSQDILDNADNPNDFFQAARQISNDCAIQLNQERVRLHTTLCSLFQYPQDSKIKIQLETLVNKLKKKPSKKLGTLILELNDFYNICVNLSAVLKTWMHTIRSSSQNPEVAAMCYGSTGISDCHYLAEEILKMYDIQKKNTSRAAGKARSSVLSPLSSSALPSSLEFKPGYRGRRMNPYRFHKSGKGVGDFSAIHLHLVGGRNEHLKLSGEGEQIRITERREMLAALRLLVGSPNYRKRSGYESCLRWLCQSLGIDHSPFTNIPPEDEESVLSNQ